MPFVPTEKQIDSLHSLLKQLKRERIEIRLIRFTNWAGIRDIKNCELEIPVYGLAKRMEWLYPPEGKEVRLPKRSLGLRLLQKLRDEAHRFAITYHRKLRAKDLLQ